MDLRTRVTLIHRLSLWRTVTGPFAAFCAADSGDGASTVCAASIIP
jgi:hypothetical protein